ncbi:MAG: diaminopimelate decarboxylase family protein [Oligoflexus sp.]
MIKDLIKKYGRIVLKRLINDSTLPESLWRLEYQDQQLSLYGVRLQDLLDEFGSPLHLVDWSRLEDQLTSFQFAKGNDGLEVFYSYKTNPLPALLRRLHQNGAGAEVISAYELWLAFHLGVSPKQIIYNGPAKSDQSIEQSIDKDILLFNFNHPEEISRVQSILRRKKRSLRVGVRVVGSDSWAGQLGLTMDEAIEAYRYLLGQNEFIVHGLHSHRGVLIRTEAELDAYLQEILVFVGRLQRELDWLPKVLDLGGSLAIPTVRYLKSWEKRLAQSFQLSPQAPQPEATLSIERYAAIILDRVQKFFKERQWPMPRIVLEPGRALTGACQMLLTRVCDVRHASSLNYVIVDAGTAVADPIKSEFHQLFPLAQKDQMQRYRMVGPICHMGDVLYPICNLPQMQAGDAVAIMDSGAYFLAEDRSFSFPRPGVVAIDRQGMVQMIRRPESFTDIIHRDELIQQL